ncbi:MAG TPA: hypothetical protein DD672_06025 [Gammaproteobacteria bacterium]|nr:hypothetical protein [Gammaproteobacteria bacterium]|tara:strand:+ start:530 stop:1465 length:936 start_codon:yes stop_codon:yes gene_type:complete
MIVRKYLRLDRSIRYSREILLFCALISSAVWYLQEHAGFDWLVCPETVVGVLGTALAIVLAFRNSSAYERWWDARTTWGGIINESRTFARQAMTIADPTEYSQELREVSTRAVKQQIAWANALRLQLQNVDDVEVWQLEVGNYLRMDDYAELLKSRNKVTALGLLNGETIKELEAHDEMDIYSYIQMDDTITRLTELQGRAERVKNTPLPTPYDYYTYAFLLVFVFLFPFAFADEFIDANFGVMVIPITVITGWIFNQLYIFGSVLARPFDQLETDVPMHFICRNLEIDLKQAIGHAEIPEPIEAVNGILR